MKWPEGKKFAFTIFDDTDLQTVENTAPVYEFLYELGFRTTKSVWPIKGSQKPLVGGGTCDDPEYLAWALLLQRRGFEIGMHNATYHTSTKEETRRGMETFKAHFGTYPKCLANHYSNEESIYWGNYRLTGARKFIHNLLLRYRRDGLFRGHIEDSPLFWGDICKEKVHYVRNFVYGDVNTLKACPYMPYYDPLRPYVNAWFAGSEGGSLDSYLSMLSERNQDRLEIEGGPCIIYAHFAKGFFRDGKLDPRFKKLMERLSRKNGWFVPTGVLLDYLSCERGIHEITVQERAHLEWRWLLHKLRMRGTS